MRRIYPYAILLLMIILVQSCAPFPVFRMNPRSKHTTFYEGKEYVHRRKDGINLTISYDHHFDDKFAMYVKIANNTGSTLRVSPSQFSYDAYKFYNPLPSDSIAIIATRTAIKPNSEILKKDLAISKAYAHQRTSDLLYGIGQALTIGTYFIDSTSYQRTQTSIASQNLAASHARGNHLRALERGNLREQRRFWQVRPIRKPTYIRVNISRAWSFQK